MIRAAVSSLVGLICITASTGRGRKYTKMPFLRPKLYHLKNSQTPLQDDAAREWSRPLSSSQLDNLTNPSAGGQQHPGFEQNINKLRRQSASYWRFAEMWWVLKSLTSSPQNRSKYWLSSVRLSTYPLTTKLHIPQNSISYK